MQTLSLEDVISIHNHLTERFCQLNDPISPPGIKDKNGLESAVHRQFAGFGGQTRYTDLKDMAASLMYGLCMNHCFHNGNKRTSLVACLTFLDKNGYIVSGISHDIFYTVVVAMAAHSLLQNPIIQRTAPGKRLYKKYGADGRPTVDEEIELLSTWIRSIARLEDRRERPLTLRVLRKILEKYKCDFGKPDQGTIVVRGPKKVIVGKTFLGGDKYEYPSFKISAHGDGIVIKKETIKELRKRFELDAKNGVDSKSFYEDYDQDAAVDFLLNEYRNTLNRLAKI